MALKIWLPLVNDTKNIGASDTTITLASGNSFVTSGGKIGNGALKLTARQMLSSTALYGSKQISWAFWVKVNTAWTADWLDSIYWVTSDGSTTDSNRSEFYTNCTKVGMWYKGGSIYGKDYVPGGWAHFAGTVDYETGKAAFYINGVVQGTTTNVDTTRYVTSVYIGDNGVDICENDVRIYDHILSAAEVKEIAQGLVLHYKLNDNNLASPNLLVNSLPHTGTTSSWSKAGTDWSNPTITDGVIRCTYTGTSQVSGGIHHPPVSKDVYENGATYTLSGWVRASKACRASFHNELMTNIGAQINVTTDWQFVSKTSTIDTSKSYFSNVFYVVASDVTENMWVEAKQWKLEKASGFTDWIPHVNDSIYNLFIGETTNIEDSSGYGHNGSTLNTVLLSPDTPRYNTSTNLVNGNSMINCGRGGMVTDSITVNFWCKYSTWGNPVSCTEGGGWNLENNNGSITFPVYISSIGYVHSKNGTGAEQLPPADYANAWHMFTGTYNKIEKTVSLYVDGELKQQNTASSGNNISYNGSNVIWLGAEATGSATAASNGMAGLFSDFRIYCTALSAEDILKLYNTGAKIDNLNSLHTGELVENNSINVEKSTVVHGSNFDENIIGKYLKYDPNVYIEPDGSAWVRVFHHNNPSAGSFASTNTFTTGAYIDENRWFNVNVCDHLDKWEFMIKGRFTVDGEDWKIRWIQNVNPMVATFAQVAATNTTAITNSRGYTYNAKQWGGLWAKKNSAYLTANNGNEGNWWGAVGSYSVYQGGIPGWGYSGHTPITTTGFNDLYVRIDNVEFIDTIVSANKSKIWTANHFIER